MLHYKRYFIDLQHPWIVFLHGAGGSLKTWKYQLQAFKNSYNLLLIDLRDHGRSQALATNKKYSFDLISNDIIEVLEKEHISEAVFMSLSFGSVLLQALSVRRPHVITAAIMAGGIFRAGFLIRGYVHTARFLNLFLTYRQMYRLFSWLLMPGKGHQVSRRIYQMQARKLSPDAYMRWLHLYREFFRLLDRFYHQEIPYPALVVMGKEDYIFLGAARKFSRYKPSVSLEILEDAGHICNIDQFEAFNIIARNFADAVIAPQISTDRSSIP